MWRRKPVLLALFGVIICLLTYVYVGIDTYARSVEIHGMFPGGFHSGELVSCEIRNEALLTFPFINPSYTLGVTVYPESADGFACYEDVSGTRWNFTERFVDLGTIDPGESKSVGLYLYPEGSGTYLRFELCLSFLMVNFRVALFDCYAGYRGNDTYVFGYRV